MAKRRSTRERGDQLGANRSSKRQMAAVANEANALIVSSAARTRHIPNSSYID